MSPDEENLQRLSKVENISCASAKITTYYFKMYIIEFAKIKPTFLHTKCLCMQNDHCTHGACQKQYRKKKIYLQEAKLTIHVMMDYHFV